MQLSREVKSRLGVTMDFRFFFEGKLSREEAASAFLAMALEASPTFRRHFLDAVAGEDSDGLARNWQRASQVARER
jgi:hypothetical protein